MRKFPEYCLCSIKVQLLFLKICPLLLLRYEDFDKNRKESQASEQYRPNVYDFQLAYWSFRLCCYPWSSKITPEILLISKNYY